MISSTVLVPVGALYYCTTDQIFIRQKIFNKPGVFAKDVFTCFVDLAKA